MEDVGDETWKCRAAVLESYNSPLVIREIEVGPLRDGECLVQVVAGELEFVREVAQCGCQGPLEPRSASENMFSNVYILLVYLCLALAVSITSRYLPLG